MFGNLIESGSHAADLKRKGRFFLGTIVFYGLLLVVTGVGSIYAYNARLDEPANDLEVLALMRFPPTASTEPERREARPAASQSHANEIIQRKELSVVTPYHGNQIASATTKELPANIHVVIGPKDMGDPAMIRDTLVGPNQPGGPGNDTGPSVRDTDTPPPPRVNATPAPIPPRPDKPLALSSQIISSKALSKPAPPYPMVAKQAHIQGPVAVQIVIDEQGRVISARATSGNPLLQGAAVQAAYQARFTPTTLNGQPVKVTGSITYNFLLN